MRKMNESLMKELSKLTKEEQDILQGQEYAYEKLCRLEKDIIVDCDKLLEAGKLIQIHPHTRFIHFPKHKHNYVEVVYMCQGSTTHIIDDKQIILSEGEILFLNENIAHELLPSGMKDIAINFIVLPEFFNTAFHMLNQEESMLSKFLLDCLSQDSETSTYFHFHVAHVLPIQNLIENMVWTIVNDYPNKRSSNQITMGLLLIQLMNNMDKMESVQKNFENDLSIKVITYIEEHYKNGTLTELAGLLGYDMQWLSKEIKKQIGKTFKELLQIKKMNQAVYFLNHTKLPGDRIIEMVGYDNTSYFYRKFKEQFGMSPKEYRNKNNM